MNSAKRYLMIALSFVLAIGVFTVIAPRTMHAVTATLVQVVNTSANPVPVSAATHVGQPVANLVTLRWDTGITSRVYGDGRTDEYDWVVPAGQALVVTSYAWSGGPNTPDTYCRSGLISRAASIDKVVAEDYAMVGANGFAAGSAVTAAVIGTGNRVTVIGGDCHVATAYIHGYLAPQ